MQSLFLRHEGYLGAIGAFLKGAEECGKFCIAFEALQKSNCCTEKNFFIALFLSPTHLGTSDTDKYSWQENYDGSSGLQGTVVTPLLSGLPVSQLEIDRWESVVGFCPLLEDPANYTPDTLNLTQDNDARSASPKLLESS